MRPRSAICLAALTALVASPLPASAEVAVHAPATVIACPASVGVRATTAAQGWTIGPDASATFRKAEVVNGEGLGGPALTCTYRSGTDATQEIARLTRPEPAGMLCTVNAVKAAQFDCFPRPGAKQEPAAPAMQH
jgi:hypothetical protein